MNVKLVESLAQAVRSLAPEERLLLEAKLKATPDETLEEVKERPFYETATPQEWAKAFREWAETDRGNMPYLSDEAISRETIYGDRG